jgi:hypothetical protein
MVFGILLKYPTGDYISLKKLDRSYPENNFNNW